LFPQCKQGFTQGSTFNKLTKTVDSPWAVDIQMIKKILAFMGTEGVAEFPRRRTIQKYEIKKILSNPESEFKARYLQIF